MATTCKNIQATVYYSDIHLKQAVPEFSISVEAVVVNQPSCWNLTKSSTMFPRDPHDGSAASDYTGFSLIHCKNSSKGMLRSSTGISADSPGDAGGGGGGGGAVCEKNWPCCSSY